MDIKASAHEEDEKLHEAYADALGEILENDDDDDVQDNLALKEKSEALGAKPGESDKTMNGVI